MLDEFVAFVPDDEQRYSFPTNVAAPWRRAKAAVVVAANGSCQRGHNRRGTTCMYDPAGRRYIIDFNFNMGDKYVALTPMGSVGGPVTLRYSNFTPGDRIAVYALRPGNNNTYYPVQTKFCAVVF